MNALVRMPPKPHNEMKLGKKRAPAQASARFTHTNYISLFLAAMNEVENYKMCRAY